MKPCNYNWNTLILFLSRDRPIYFSELFFNDYSKFYHFSLRVWYGSITFETKSREKNFKDISIAILLNKPDTFPMQYSFDNYHNRMELYFLGRR